MIETLAALKQSEKKTYLFKHILTQSIKCCKQKITINCNFLVVHKSLARLGHIFNDTVYIFADLIPFTLKEHLYRMHYWHYKKMLIEQLRQDECHIRINLNLNLWILTYIGAKEFFWYLILCSNISMYIFNSVLYTFPMVLSKRISWTIQSFLSWWSPPWFSWCEWVIQGWYNVKS